MKKLLKYLKGYTKESIIAPLFKCLEACFELIVPIVTARVIDIGIANKNIKFIWIQCLILVALGVIGLICSLTAQYYAAKAAMGFGANLRKALYKHINKFDYATLDEVGTSTLVTRITGDVNLAQTGVNQFLRLFMRTPVIVIGAVILSFYISHKLSIIFLVTMVLIGIAIYIIVRFTLFIYKKVQGYLDLVVLHTRENYNGVRVVRAFTREEEEKEIFVETNNDLKKTQIFAGRISALLNPVTYMIANFGIIAILHFGGIQVHLGNLSQGQIVALTNYMTQILLAQLVMVNLIVSVTRAAASAIRINEVFAVVPKQKEGVRELDLAQVDQEVLRFNQVSFAYRGSEVPSLSEINFSVLKNQTIGVIGGTGSGKTTLMNLISRLYDVSSGSIEIAGKKIEEFTFPSLQKNIGIVPQKSVLFSGTIRENMQWRKEDATDEEIRKALEVAQALEVVESKRHGLDEVVLTGGSNFSGGQRQRLCIARALVGNPGILILDDSASALDFVTDAKLRKALRENGKGRVTFIVSQRVSTVKDADQIIVLDQGKMAGIGTHKELINNSEVYREICLSQFSKEEVAKYV